MHKRKTMKQHSLITKTLGAAVAAALLAGASLQAQTTYTWIQTAGGTQNWTNAANWLGGVVPNPVAGDTIDFSTVNINNTTLNLGGNRTATNWKFGDASGNNTWTIANDGSELNIAGTNPTFTILKTTTVLATITGSGGIIKEGGGQLVLRNTSNSFTGGITVNAGGLQQSSTAGDVYGAAGSTITWNANNQTFGLRQTSTYQKSLHVSDGVFLNFSCGNNGSGNTFTGPVTGGGGGGGIRINGGTGQRLLVWASTENTFTGDVFNANGAFGGDSQWTFNSIGDTAGAGNIYLGAENNNGRSVYSYGAGAVAPLVLDHRALVLNAGNEDLPNSTFQNLNADPSNTVTINKDIIVPFAGFKTFTLGGVNTGDNIINGTVWDDTNGGVVKLSKAGGGKWILGAVNTYSGGTEVLGGELVANVAGAIPNGSLSLPSAGSSNLTLNANQSVTALFIGGAQQSAGVYTSAEPWLSGTGTLTVGVATAGPIFWDIDGATPGAGGATPTGTWNAGNTFWSASAAGDAATSAWTAGRTATFAAGSDATGTYTVNVDGTQDIGGLTIQEGDVTLSGGTSLRLVNDALAIINGGATGTVTTPIADDGTAHSLTKAGSGSLLLDGSNTYTGATLLGGGSLIAGSTDALGAGGNVTFSGGTLSYNSAGAAGDFSTGDRIKNSSSAITVDTNGESPSMAGDIDNSNTAGLTKTGAGTLTLSGSNNYGGTTTVSGGTLAVSNAANSGVFNLNSGGTLQLSGSNSNSGQINNNAGSTLIGTGSGSMGTSRIVPRGTLQLQADGGGTWSNLINGVGRNGNPVVIVDRETPGAVAGSDLWTLNNAPFNVDNNGSLTFEKGANVTSGTPTIDITQGFDSSESINPSTQTFTANDVDVLVNGSGNSRGRNYIFQGTSTGNVIYGKIDESNTSRIITFIKRGTGTWTISSNDNDYTGNTTVEARTLGLDGAGLTSPITVETGAALGFGLTTPSTTTQSCTFQASTTVEIFGTPADTSYTLLTASSITGTPTLDPPIAGYSLVIDGGNPLKLVGSGGGGSAFDTWATSNGVPTGSEAVDSDGGGQINLYEFGLGGNPDPVTGGANDDGSLLNAFSSDVVPGGDPEGVLTILVRDAAAAGFSASGNDQVSTADGITYTVSAENTLPVASAATVAVSGTTVTDGLPPAPAGYTYVSFYITGSEGYFQVTVEPAP